MNFKEYLTEAKTKFKVGDLARWSESEKADNAVTVESIKGNKITLKVKTWSFPQKNEIGTIIKTEIDNPRLSEWEK